MIDLDYIPDDAPLSAAEIADIWLIIEACDAQLIRRATDEGLHTLSDDELALVRQLTLEEITRRERPN